MKKYLFLFTSILLLLGSCSSDLDDTVFIPDSTDATMPAYTEWGYNSFGAKYEREYFLSSNSIVPCKIISKEGRLYFSLIGELSNNTQYSRYSQYPQYTKMTLTFSFPASAMTTYRDLLVLNDKKIDLSNASCEVKIEKEYGPEVTIVSLNSSYLHFKRAQLLRVDEVEDRVILSGTFDIKFLINNKPEAISSGRFDVGINKDFYSYDN
jgi:hypothetical protein